VFKPIEVKALPGYRLYLRYADGVEGEIDLSHLVGKGVFALWSDPKTFEHATIGTSGQICWGDRVDLCPDAIYLQITGKSPEAVFPNLAQVKTKAPLIAS